MKFEASRERELKRQLVSLANGCVVIRHLNDGWTATTLRGNSYDLVRYSRSGFVRLAQNISSDEAVRLINGYEDQAY